MINCEYCENNFLNIKQLTRHQKSESCKKIKYLLEKNTNILKIQIIELKNKLDTVQKINNEKDNTISILKEKSEEYRKIVEKAAVKSTKTVNNNNTYNRNNYLNYISKEPIKFSELQQNISKLVTTKTIMLDNDDFNEHITQNMLKDENGKDKVICTDINRKNFTYKDEKSGKLISDPELERLREQLIKGSNNKMIKKNLLDKLVKKYEGTNIDPYNKFYEYLQNIQFGTPFIEHVAKKTYIKTKSNSNKNINTNDQEEDDGYEECEDNDDFEKIDKLYHQLKEEFEDNL
jgi:hypothetical protein